MIKYKEKAVKHWLENLGLVALYQYYTLCITDRKVLSLVAEVLLTGQLSRGDSKSVFQVS